MSNTPWRGVGVVAGAIATIFVAAGRSGIEPRALLWGLFTFGVLALALLGLNAFGDRRRDAREPGTSVAQKSER